jgi:hypothetical protein
LNATHKLVESLSSTDGIATTQVFKVIRKRVQRADGGIRVPARLELHALALNRALTQAGLTG